VESKLGPLDTSANNWPIVPATGDCEDGKFGGMKSGRGNLPEPLCPPQNLLNQTGTRTRAAAVGGQRLTWCVARLYSVQCTRKQFGIRHMHILNTFLLGMTDTMTSQNIDHSSWDTLYN
jgi:hypothetical protein